MAAHCPWRRFGRRRAGAWGNRENRPGQEDRREPAPSALFRSLGAYQPGADPETDRAVKLHPHIEAFLCQGTKEDAPFAPCVEQLQAMMA